MSKKPRNDSNARGRHSRRSVTRIGKFKITKDERSEQTSEKSLFCEYLNCRRGLVMLMPKMDLVADSNQCYSTLEYWLELTPSV